jgi:hypothetical protein
VTLIAGEFEVFIDGDACLRVEGNWSWSLAGWIAKTNGMWNCLLKFVFLLESEESSKFLHED